MNRVSGNVSRWNLLLLPVVSALVCVGCASTATVKKPEAGGGIEWPGRRDVSDITNLGAVDGGAALAASAAIREVVQRVGPESELFSKCPSPAAALDARVFMWRNVYYVTVDERFDRCGEARSRFPDWFESYAVSPAGVVLARRGGER
ncbi:hypothetical protein NR798_07215 [Archangium gephyra]|uniref:hypothetical protein n=1 Tax=Archangium gephyra TaxID=48 RepID=UPI0035D40A10